MFVNHQKYGPTDFMVKVTELLRYLHYTQITLRAIRYRRTDIRTDHNDRKLIFIKTYKALIKGAMVIVVILHCIQVK